MSLVRYRAKRDFRITPEPAGQRRGSAGALRFVIQKHAARRLHYDFRLELDGTLKSWAVPKGPSLDPADKRLAVHVEDHPLEYGGFEGVIPEKQYGAGQVIVWDQGTWTPLGDARRDYREGHLKFRLDGEKMHGDWALVRMHGHDRDGKADEHDNWLLIKEKDPQALPGQGEQLVKERPESVISGRSVEELKGRTDADVWDSKESDPAKAYKPASMAGKAARVTKTAKPAKPAKADKPAKTAQPEFEAGFEAGFEPGSEPGSEPGFEPKSAGEPKAKPARSTPPAKAAKAAQATLGGEPATPAVTKSAGPKAELPAMLEPQLATLVDTAPQDQGWAYEVKFDGYRLLARIARGKVALLTRNGHDWSHKFPDIARALEGLGLQSGWLDGEVCVMNQQGVSSFSLLQQWLVGEGEGAKLAPCYMIFDLPYCNGRDLRAFPLSERKAALAAVLAAAAPDGVLRLSEHLEAAAGAHAQAQACKLGLEGLIGKRLDGPYINGRSRDWIKLKCRQRQEFVIAGYTPPQGSRAAFGSLLLGVYEPDGTLRYAGRVGTGFDQANLASTLKRLRAVAADESPFAATLPATQRVRGTQWVRPQLVAEVTFAEWTSDGLVRQAAFEGLREDKPARAVRRELPVAANRPKATAAKSGVSTRTAASNKSMAAIKDAAAPQPRAARKKVSMSASTVGKPAAGKKTAAGKATAAKAGSTNASAQKGVARKDAADKPGSRAQAAEKPATRKAAAKLARKVIPKASSAAAKTSSVMPTASPRTTAKASPKVVSKAALKAASKAAPKAAPKDTPKDAQKAAPKGAPEDAAKAAPKGASKAAPKTADGPAVRTTAAKAGGEEVAGVLISHPDRVVYPDDGVTKLEVTRFYERVAERLLPFIENRPLSIVRCPGGIGGACFFQKHAADFDLPGVEQAMITDSQGKNPYIVVRDVRGLVGLSQMGTLELHAWNATMANIEKPDMLVIDFDPADDVPWNDVAHAARAARALFEALGLQCFLKTTGGKGLHVVVPFVPGDGWDDVKEFTHAIALRLVEAFPERFIATATKARRKGKIFVDYLRNGRGATAVAPFSLRARPGATVAVPLAWDELGHDWRAEPVQLRAFMAARGKQSDPWRDYFAVKQSITAKMKRAVGLG